MRVIRAQDKAVCGELGEANLHPDLGTSQLNYECTQDHSWELEPSFRVLGTKS